MFSTIMLFASSINFLISTYAFLVHDYATATVLGIWAIYTYLVAQGEKKK